MKLHARKSGLFFFSFSNIYMYTLLWLFDSLFDTLWVAYITQNLIYFPKSFDTI